MKPARHYPPTPAGVARIEKIEAAVETLFSQELPPVHENRNWPREKAKDTNIFRHLTPSQ
jgi:hypothetical protein